MAKWLLIKASVGLLSLFFCVALLVTQTRGAWLAAGCAMVVVLGLMGRRGWLLLGTAALVLVLAIFSIGPAKLLDELTVYGTNNEYATTTGGNLSSVFLQDRNLSARVILWQRAAHAIADAPLTGIGFGAFPVVSQLPYPEVKGFVPDPDMSHVHNIVLQMGVDFGVPGIIAFVALCAIIGWLLVRLVQQSVRPSLVHTWSLGLLGSFIAYLVYNMLNITALGAPPAIAVWFLFGLCVGAGEWARVELSITEEKPVMPTPDLTPLPSDTEEGWSEWERQAWAATTRPTKNQGQNV
jgi:putative inorganic carbon (HCO3(-)) transporter